MLMLVRSVDVQESWSAEVRARLIQFLEETLPSQSSSELVAIYLNVSVYISVCYLMLVSVLTFVE